MRLMTSLGLCSTVAPNVYRANEKTTALNEPIGHDGVPCMYVHVDTHADAASLNMPDKLTLM